MRLGLSPWNVVKVEWLPFGVRKTQGKNTKHSRPGEFVRARLVSPLSALLITSAGVMPTNSPGGNCNCNCN